MEFYLDRNLVANLGKQSGNIYERSIINDRKVFEITLYLFAELVQNSFSFRFENPSCSNSAIRDIIFLQTKSFR